MLELQELEKRIGYQFKNRALLRRATTHRSFSADHNERLEFLGDSVLGCTIGYELFKLDSHFSEGRLSRVRSNLVCEKALDEIAADVGISDFLLMGEGEVKSGGRTRPSILADAMEAVFGAVFLDGGFEQAQTVILRLYAKILADLPERNGKRPEDEAAGGPSGESPAAAGLSDCELHGAGQFADLCLRMRGGAFRHSDRRHRHEPS